VAEFAFLDQPWDVFVLLLDFPDRLVALLEEEELAIPGLTLSCLVHMLPPVSFVWAICLEAISANDGTETVVLPGFQAQSRHLTDILFRV
jgi:hypothetical protein